MKRRERRAHSQEDFVEAAVALAGNGQESATYELAGDEAWMLSDLAAEVSRQIGKLVVYNDLPESEYAALFVEAGLPKEFVTIVSDSDAGAE